VVFRVGHVQHPAVRAGAETLRPAERSPAEVPVGQAGGPAADAVLHPPVIVGNQDAVVVGIRDEQPLRPGVAGDLAGEGQHPLGRVFTLQNSLKRRAVEVSCVLELRDQRLQRLIDRAVDAFPGQAASDVALRVDEEQGRPGPHGVLLPQLEGRVVHDGVLDSVA
jgi:hypothetical protein